MLDATKAPDLGSTGTEWLTVRVTKAYPPGALYSADPNAFTVVVLSLLGWPKMVIDQGGRARLVRKKKGQTHNEKYVYVGGREYRTIPFDLTRVVSAAVVSGWLQDYIRIVGRLTPSQRLAAGIS